MAPASWLWKSGSTAVARRRYPCKRGGAGCAAPCLTECPWFGCLRLTDVSGLEALRAADDIELQSLALGERLEAIALDRGIVDEHVLATFLLDETETLRLVEPLYRSTRHFENSFDYGVRPQHAAFRGKRPAALAGFQRES